MEKKILTVCSFCVYNVKTSDGKWGILDEDLTKWPHVVLVSHGLCPDCAEAYERNALKEIEKMKALSSEAKSKN